MIIKGAETIPTPDIGLRSGKPLIAFMAFIHVAAFLGVSVRVDWVVEEFPDTYEDGTCSVWIPLVEFTCCIVDILGGYIDCFA